MSLEIINKHIDSHFLVMKSISNTQKKEILKIKEIIVDSLSSGGTLFWCGNGGSASDAQHLSGELIGRYVSTRKPLKSITLLTGGAEGSCIANDFGYKNLFSRQLEGLGSKGDVLIGITTSGNSENIISAFEMANSMSISSIGFLGKGGGKAKNLTNHSMIVNSDITARIQEVHILVGHILCDLIEEGLNLNPKK